MPSITMRRGKAAELRVMAELLRHGLDVYAPLVDERGIDLIVRARDEHDKVRYWEIQVKSVKGYGQVIGLNYEILASSPTYILIVNYHFDDRDEYMYLLQRQALLHVAEKSGWGDLWVRKAERDFYFSEHNQTIEDLAERMSEPTFMHFVGHPPLYKGQAKR